ncbi:unnamed protein product [Calypogeia fissa]
MTVDTGRHTVCGRVAITLPGLLAIYSRISQNTVLCGASAAIRGHPGLNVPADELPPRPVGSKFIHR